MARRATAVRVFTAWAQRTGRTATDPGALLGSPKAHRTLPPALRVDEARALLEAAAVHADDGSPVGAATSAILELLYATGIRVGELCGLDVDDLDHERRVVRVFGKGRKERTVPFGAPAERAVDAWLRTGRPGAGRARRRGGAVPRARGAGGSTSGRSARSCTPGCRRPGRARPRPARPAAHRRHAPARGRRRPAHRAGAARPRVAGDHADLHPRHHRPATAGLPAGASAGLSRRLAAERPCRASGLRQPARRAMARCRPAAAAGPGRPRRG